MIEKSLNPLRKAAAGTDLSKPNPFPSNNTTFWAIKYEHTGGILRLDRRASNILNPYTTSDWENSNLNLVPFSKKRRGSMF